MPQFLPARSPKALISLLVLGIVIFATNTATVQAPPDETAIRNIIQEEVACLAITSLRPLNHPETGHFLSSRAAPNFYVGCCLISISEGYHPRRTEDLASRAS
jgi:hypothetical protein